ncbi:hypothetical protein IFR05_004013 [Cadophora sp. M221]|nr:hypothetical protein IFR05_004013 [Cadophora sp. M221]
MKSAILVRLGTILGSAIACDSCYGPFSAVVHERLVRRIQPGSNTTIAEPRGPLEWGELNFLHTTDTHGWLEGHLKEMTYSADWGDFVSFSRHMKQKAGRLGVDLLIVDTGDLHDGTGFSDVTTPNGVYSNPIHSKLDYDVLAIGNHELYVNEIAYEHFYNFSKFWGDKYVTSNVQIINPLTSRLEYVGSKYRYFTTKHGIRIMTFGVIFDFGGNSNVSRIIKAADMVQQQWFLDAINFDQPIDLFLLIGHNPIRTSDPVSSWPTVYKAIRAARPTVPIQIFGGHTHIRDFEVYDDRGTGFEAGRYCETLGWLSMSGINSSSYTGSRKPRNVPNPSRKATSNSTSGLVYSRRYLDWNRRTFEYHAASSQADTFDYQSGLRVSGAITDIRKSLNITYLFGCAPDTYCVSCQPIESPRSIYGLISTAVGDIVVKPSRSTTARYIIVNTGGVRFDLVKGPFTIDDSIIVAPFPNAFKYLPSVPYAMARTVLDSLNAQPGPAKRDSAGLTWGAMPQLRDSCQDPTLDFISGHNGRRDLGVTLRQRVVTPGYTTVDDFGTEGDDTPHSHIPEYPIPKYVQGLGGFPSDGTDPNVVDVIFLDYFASKVVGILRDLGANYTVADVDFYLDKTFSVQQAMIAYAKENWQANMPSCPGGPGVGSKV